MQAKPRVRKYHHKSRDGCVTCRKRRVRCDLTRPKCRACIRIGSNCEWQQNPIHALVPLSMSSEELRSFQYYRENTMLELRGHYDDGFWNGALLRMCHRHRFLEHFVVALSSLDEAYRMRTNPHRSDVALERYCFSLGQYQKALAGFRLNFAQTDNIELVLASCLVCVCIELWHGDHAAAGCHALTGSQLAWSHYLAHDQSARADGQVLPMLRAMLVRLCDQLGVDAGNLSSITEAHESSRWPAVVQGSAAGIHDAHKQFYEMLENYTANADNFSVETRESEARALRQQLGQWYRQLQYTTAGDVGREYHLLALHYHAVAASLDALATSDERRYDDYTAHFEELVKHCEPFVQGKIPSHGKLIQSWRTLDGSIVMALLFVAWKCRDAKLRRTAARMLYRARRLEGIYHSAVIGAIAEQMVALEEDADSVLDDVKAGIPSTIRRLRMIDFEYDPGVLSRLPPDEAARSWNMHPPSMQYRYVYVDTPDVLQTIRFRLKPYASIGGFGLKSCFWYPMSRGPTIMDEEVPVATRFLEGPHLGISPLKGTLNTDTRSQLYFRFMAVHVPLETTDRPLIRPDDSDSGQR